jgi:hypothetical protein
MVWQAGLIFTFFPAGDFAARVLDFHALKALNSPFLLTSTTLPSWPTSSERRTGDGVRKTKH